MSLMSVAGGRCDSATPGLRVQMLGRTMRQGSKARRYWYPSMPLTLQVCSSEYKFALALAPATVSANNQLRLSCSYVHERRAWLFCGSELAGQRAAIVMSLVQSARLNGHEPWAYLRDVLARLPTQLNSQIEELLPHRWQPSATR